MYFCIFNIFKTTAKLVIFKTTRITRPVELMEHELPPFLNTCLNPVFSGIRVTRSLVFCVMFCRSLSVILSFVVVFLLVFSLFFFFYFFNFFLSFLLLSVPLRVVASDYPFGIFKLFL
jgi:hypothetical protein